MCVWKFRRRAIAVFKRADDRRTTSGLHTKHARPFFPDPSEGLHFVERFPHSDEAGAATRGIQDHIGKLPVQLLGQFVAEGLLTLDAIRLFKRGHVEPTFSRFAPGNLSAAIVDETVDESNVRSELARLDDVRARSVARHENVRFETGSGGIGCERSAGVAGTGNRELGRAKVFRHGYGNGHASRFETLRRILRFVFDPKIDVVSELLRAQQRRPAFAKRNRIDIRRKRQKFAIAPQRFLARSQSLAFEAVAYRIEIINGEKRSVTSGAEILQM